jgi:membrane protein implicated in regulation of membrane protease activity
MARPLLRYALLQVPDVLFTALVLCALRRWWGLTDGAAALLLALWIAKDAAMYPFVRRSLSDGGSRIGAAALIGAEGVSEDALDPSGWVRVRGELWRAEAIGEPVAARSRVRVRGIRGLTLSVEPLRALDSSESAPRT